MSLHDLPDEVFLENLLPILPVADLSSLSATCKRFHYLANDETLWLHKTISTFRLSPSTFAPPAERSGWSKRVFRGLSKPRTFVWGSTNNDRLGLPRPPPNQPRIMIHIRHLPTPREISSQFEKDPGATTTEVQDSLAQASSTAGIQGGGLVELQAGGWSFAARDLHGGVWAWGQLNGMNILGPRDWSSPFFTLSEPTRIPLPCRAEQISLGRQHLLVLDQDNLIWEMQAFGRAYHHTAPALTSPTHTGTKSFPHHIVQVSAGWSHSACLTADGSIYYWFPMSQTYSSGLTPIEELTGLRSLWAGETERTAFKCGKVGAECVFALEAIPLASGAEDDDNVRSGDATASASGKVIKIASGADFVIALKSNGDVWLRQLRESGAGRWQYLPAFSGPSITHISAQSQSFTTYSPATSRVHFARIPDDLDPSYFETLQPEPLPGLQGKGVIQIAIGDHHYAALTNKGEVLTWGNGDNGELGLGSTVRSIAEPTRVRFDLRSNAASASASAAEASETEEEPFVFSITAAGWHTGALILGDPSKPTVDALNNIQLNPDDPSEMRSRGPGSDMAADQGQGGFFGPMFRIGFPGRIGFAARGARGGGGGGPAPQARWWQPRGSEPPA